MATICAFVKKRDPTRVTSEDLDKIVEFITRNYVVNPLKSFLTVAFPNSGFTQPAFEKAPEKRLEYAEKVLAHYDESSASSDTCVFTGRPALPLDLAYGAPPGRAFRQHIPLLTGENVINFFPNGDPGLPVSGLALLAIQALPLGCAKCAGRLLAVHSDNADITLEFAREFLTFNQKALTLTQESGAKKMPEQDFSARTLLIQTLLKAEQRRCEEAKDERPCSLTAYHLTNSGQAADINIYYLPLEITDFLFTAETAVYSEAWHLIIERAWRYTQNKRSESRPFANTLFEDLFQLPINAQQFLRTYLLRESWRYAKEGDPRRSYSLRDEVHLVSWQLTELFLRKVMLMEKDRINLIRRLGDQLADFVATQNEKRFFRGLYVADKYYIFRNLLLKADLLAVRRGLAPLVAFDEYITVFEEGEGVANTDWSLARDLLLIRMVEKLYHTGWFQSHQDALPDSNEDLGVVVDKVDSDSILEGEENA